MAYKTAVIGSMAHSYAPARKVGQKDPAVWRELSIQMRDGGAAVAEAARKNDPAALHKAADRLESSCTACHSVFRP